MKSTSAIATSLLAGLLTAFGAGPADASGRVGPIDGEGWSEVDASHLSVISDAGAGVTEEVAARLEAFLDAFARLAPALETEPPAPTVVVAFREPETFASYLAGSPPDGGRILGQFLPSSDGSFLILSTAEEGLPAVEVLQHELVHHLVETNFPGAPRWLHEGLAEVYGTFERRGGRAWIGRAPARHLRFLEGTDWSVEDILHVGRGDHSGADPSFYAVSWLLVHRLLAAGPSRMEGLADLLLGLDADSPADDRFERALGVSLRDLEAELRDDLAAGRVGAREIRLGSAGAGVGAARAAPPDRVLWMLGRLSLRSGRAERAEAEMHRALDHDPRSPEAHAGLARLRELRGRFDEAAVLYDDAAVLGPRDPWTSLVRGRFLLQHRRVEVTAAREALGRALAAEPAWIEARRWLALSHLGGGGSAEEGLRILRPARDAAPGRVDLAEVELRLSVAAEEFGAARGVVAELTGRVPGTALADLEELIDREEHLAAAREAAERGELEEAALRLDAAIARTSDPAVAERLEAALRELQARSER